jgi:hypothetical protein
VSSQKCHARRAAEICCNLTSLMGQAGSKLESRREIQIQCSGEDQIGGRWQEPGDLNRREPSALLKLACCRAGSALSTRMETSSIQHHHDHRRGSRGGHARRRAGEQGKARARGSTEEVSCPEGPQGLQTRPRHRALSVSHGGSSRILETPAYHATASLPSTAGLPRPVVFRIANRLLTSRGR